MPTAREIDEAAAKALLQRSHKKPIAVAGLGALLLAASFAAGSSLGPEPAPALKTAAPLVETPPQPLAVKPVVPKGEPRSLLNGDPAAEAKTTAKAPPKKLEKASAPEAVAAAPSATKVYLVLLAVCGVLVGAGYVLKKKFSTGRALPGKEKLLVIRDQLALDAKRRVVVLGVEGRTLVVAVTGEQMTLLSEFTALEAEPVLMSAPAAETERPAEAVHPGAAFAAAYVAAKARTGGAELDAAESLIDDEHDDVRVTAPAAASARRAESPPTSAAAEAAANGVPAKNAAATRPATRPVLREPESAQRFGSPFRRIDAPAAATARPKPRNAAADRFNTLLEATEGAR